QSLLKPGHQRAMLDAHGGHGKLVDQLAQAWQTWQAARHALENAQATQETHEARRQELQWQLDQLEQLDLAENEWEQLTAQHQRLAHVQTLIEVGARALESLDGDDASIRHGLAQVCADIQALANHDAALQPIAESLDSALIICQEAT